MIKVLFLGAHCDDIELCAAGTAIKLREQNSVVHCIVLSKIFDGVDLSDEVEESLEIITPWRMVKDFTPRQFSTQRVEILQFLFDIQKDEQYDYVFTHSTQDEHPDHFTVANEAKRAFKHTNLLTWTCEWNARRIIKNYFVKLEHRHVQKKLEALGCYKSQQHRNYFRQDVIVGAMHVNGMMVNTEFAEAFQVVNLIA